MAKALTRKRKGFVKDFVKTGIASLAVKENFDVKDDDSARSLGSQLLSDPKVQKAIADQLPDDLLAEKHLALLNKMEGEEIDVNAVSKGLDLAYKVKGTYAPEKKISLNRNINEEIKDKSQLEALRKEYEEKLKTKLIEENEPQ